MNKPTSTNPTKSTEWATPSLQASKNPGLGISETWKDWEEEGVFCSCQIMVSIPFYLFKKFQACSDRGKLLDI